MSTQATHPAVSQPDGFAPGRYALPPAGFSPFDLNRATEGDAFIHRNDVNRLTWRTHVTREIRLVDHAEHPVYLVWSGEWLPYQDDEEGIEQLYRDFYMVDGWPPYEPKMAQCMHCSEAIVQWAARPQASWTHLDRHLSCGLGEENLATPAPGSVFDPNQKAGR